MSRDPLDCTGCTECCRVLFFGFPVDETIADKFEFYQARGCSVKIGERRVVVGVPHICVHLTEDGCSIHNKRPAACRNYDCRDDEFLDTGNYK